MSLYWIKASDCESGSCVELAWSPDHLIGVRNSNVPAEVVWFSKEEWRTFIEAAKREEFDV